MLKIKNVTAKNFMSIGAQTQSIRLENSNLTLVLGENIDLGGGGSRNGVGKTALVQAISYALFGAPVTNIKRDNLINKTNNKSMIVAIDFEKDGNHYRIERGRRPSTLRFLANNKTFEADDEGTDEAHGESRITQLEIEKVLGFSKELFRQIIALNTFTEPFLNQGAAAQRSIIEELLGVTQLSLKADVLKEKSKKTKDSITEEEYKIKALIETNNTIQSNIDSLKKKSAAWKMNHEKQLKVLNEQISKLQHIDIENEIENIKNNNLLKELNSVLWQLKKDKATEASALDKSKKRLETLHSRIAAVVEKKCPTCGQDLHDTNHEEMFTNFQNEIDIEETQIKATTSALEKVNSEIEQIRAASVDLAETKTHYGDLDKAYQHRSNLNQLVHELEVEGNQKNPFEEQITQLEQNGLQEISYDQVNYLTRLREHQEFLWKLLTNKESFIRKKIIDQNILYLNHRLNYYLEKLGLAHEVRFLNDLSVEITELGREYDFDNLSRGEKNRLILGLSFAFRDIWESLNTPINLLFIDELIDSGLDQLGVEAALGVLKKMGRDQGKDVFLISHREELLSRVSKVMLVKKENGFTAFADDVEETTNLEI